jgi:uncharacterized membrane protein YfcA
VTDLPDLAFIAFPMDKRLIAAVLIAAVAGLVRGFSGFGSALVYVPLISAIYEPRTAAATLVLIDVACGFPFAVNALRRWDWREVVLISGAAALGIPIGTITLMYADPIFLRWAIAVFVVLITSVIAAGWRYHGSPNRALMIGTGLMAGFFGGAFQMDGPPVVIFWLGGSKVASVVRANILVFLELSGFIIVVAYEIAGLLSHEVLRMSFWLFWPFLLAMIVGARRFRLASERTYRRIAYVLIYLAAIGSLPVFHSWGH